MERDSADETVRRLVDDYRDCCLWFLREDYYPLTPAEWQRVLTLIETRGDLDAFHRVAEIRAFLARPSGTTVI